MGKANQQVELDGNGRVCTTDGAIWMAVNDPGCIYVACSVFGPARDHNCGYCVVNLATEDELPAGIWLAVEEFLIAAKRLLDRSSGIAQAPDATSKEPSLGRANYRPATKTSDERRSLTR